MCTYSLAAEPGTASDHKPSIASNTPSTTGPPTAAAEVVTTTGESATNTPMTSAAQSCQRRHVPTCSVAIATTPFLEQGQVYALTGQPVKTPHSLVRHVPRAGQTGSNASTTAASCAAV